jgi:hypothetical protein
MPVLRNPKHEQFVQFIVQGAKLGWTQGESYQRAGYKASGHGAEVNAARLLKKAAIQDRLAELAAPAVKRTKITLDSLIDQFDAVFDGAMADKQFGAAGSAATVKSKLIGFLRDRVEVGGPGSFDACETVDDVVDKLLDDIGDAPDALEVLDNIRARVEQRAAAAAQDVTPEPPRDIAGGEAEKALVYLGRRPKPGRRS